MCVCLCALLQQPLRHLPDFDCVPDSLIVGHEDHTRSAAGRLSAAKFCLDGGAAKSLFSLRRAPRRKSLFVDMTASLTVQLARRRLLAIQFGRRSDFN